MGYKLKTNIAKRANYGSQRNTSVIKFLVYHYTANDGDTDEANANYFHNKVVKASAHRFVDDNSVTISVPDNYVAWSVGGKKVSSKGGKFHGICTNTNSISIEMCDTKRNGKYEVTSATRANAIALGKEFIKKYNISRDHVIRHFDVTGKNCPAYFVSNESDWEKFKDELFGKTSSSSKSSKKYSGTLPALGKANCLKKGSKGINVQRLQKFLNWCLGTKLSIDGDFGKKTDAAVKKFQKKYGLSADGSFGPKSLAKAEQLIK